MNEVPENLDEDSGFTEDEITSINEMLTELDEHHISKFKESLKHKLETEFLTQDEYDEFMKVFFNPEICKERAQRPSVHKTLKKINTTLDAIQKL